MTAAFILGKNVNLTLELGVRLNGAGLCKNLSALDFVSLNTAEECADVVASLCIVKDLTEHFDTGNNNFSALISKTNDLNFLTDLELSALNSTCSNCAAACDCEDVLNRHKEGHVGFTVRCRDIAVNSVHKLIDGLELGSVGVIAVVLKSLES